MSQQFFPLTMLFTSLLLPVAAAADTEALSPWQARAGISLIAPKSNNGSILDNTADVTLSNRVGPTVNIAYFITPHWAIDLLGGLAFKHQIDVNGSRAGEAKHLPPILSLQYHFRPEATLRPYVGLGLNYTTFLDEKLDNGAKLKLGDSWGPALQAGLDYALDNHWTIGADIRYARINTKVKINGLDAGDVSINPIVYTLNVGYRF
ncbi:OmpW family protein [Methylobacillus methanolivorans]|uniref:OmpW family protein n=1 Tax=Methylobacillus methanolivorans TaxID=1848927 RepID=A0ABW8GIG9_9PROT